ncbi:hypothetical protein NW062_02170 [Mycoplasmopsis cynos]|nr:hypothetical protein NW062_02170 [Mycoplasmopsis cynos]
MTKLNFVDYFLIIQDVINFAHKKGILIRPGRGSAAGSLISYLLNITSINPLEFDLLFERFLNEDRNGSLILISIFRITVVMKYLNI